MKLALLVSMAGGDAALDPYHCFTSRLIGDWEDKSITRDRLAEAGLFSLRKQRLEGHRSLENQVRRSKQRGVTSKEIKTKS